jgi:hypothetical protein
MQQERMAITAMLGDTNSTKPLWTFGVTKNGIGLPMLSREYVLRILSEATEPLYSSEIAVRLNREPPA